MSNNGFLKRVVAWAATAVATLTAAHASDVDLLTCNLAKAGQPFPSASWDHLHFREARDGTFIIPGPVREEELCIQNATVGGGFGAFMVVAELCNSTPQPLFDWLTKNRPSLQRSTATSEPKLIAVFSSQHEYVSVFYGPATFQSRVDNAPHRDPNERPLSFACSFKGSGPQ